MKRGLVSFLTLMTLGCASAGPRIEGEVDLSYVPERTDDIPRENEAKAKIDLQSVFPLSIGEFFIGGKAESYGGIKNPLTGFDPHRIHSNIFTGMRFGNFDVYFSRSSTHPISGIEEETVPLRYLYNERMVIPPLQDIYLSGEYDSITEMGIKWRFSVPLR